MSNILLTSAEITTKLLPDSSEWTCNHVSVALDEIAHWYYFDFHEDAEKRVVIDCSSLVKEVSEMNVSMGSRDRIIADLERVAFGCEFVMPAAFSAKLPGFRLLNT